MTWLVLRGWDPAASAVTALSLSLAPEPEQDSFKAQLQKWKDKMEAKLKFKTKTPRPRTQRSGHCKKTHKNAFPGQCCDMVIAAGQLVSNVLGHGGAGTRAWP